LAGGFGLLPPTLVVWSLVALNVLALGVGTWATARLGLLLGSSAWLGLTFVFNPGLFFELSIDGTSIVGYALVMLALVQALQKNWNAAACLFSLGALARETMILMAIGVFLYFWLIQGIRRWSLVLAPGLTILAWAIWIRIAFVGLPIRSGMFFGRPLAGITAAVPAWFAEGGTDVVLGLLTLLCAAGTALAAIRRPSALAWGTVPFASLLFVLNTYVLEEEGNVTRAMAPLITGALVLGIIHWDPSRTRGHVMTRGNHGRLH
jgi:hypothetical protein